MKEKILRMAALLLTVLVCLTGNPSGITAAPKTISRKTAISIAAKNAKANTKSKEFKLKEAELDDDEVWEIEFYYKGTKYEYEIHAVTKKILEKDVEISKATVKQLALKKANVKSSKVKSWDIDHNDSKNYYSVKFSTSKKTYTLRINAADGKIMSYKTANISSSKYISEDKAKSIALAHAKKNASITDVNYEKAELEKDDGKVYYDIEFTSGSYEFEYEIDAVNGKIIDWEMDNVDQDDDYDDDDDDNDIDYDNDGNNDDDCDDGN